MAEALDSPRRKADFERINREERDARLAMVGSLTPGERIEAAIELNRVAVDFAAELGRSHAPGPA